jgi:anti-sigma factor RsiW
MMLNDETLMLFADGLLDAPERERVERLVTADPGLRARVDVFRVTGPDLARLFDAHLNAPVPAKLRDFVTAQARAPVEASRPKHAGAAALKARFAVQRPMPAWNITALAASVAVVAGIGLGWLLHGVASSDGTGGSDFVEIENQRLLAHGPLLGALETARSGSTTTVALGSGEEAQLRVRMTFQNEAREYCRQYEIAVPSRERFSGVACRAAGQWSVAMHALLPPAYSAAEQTIPAGPSANGAMDAVIGTMIDGNPVVGEQEAAIIGKGWQN